MNERKFRQDLYYRVCVISLSALPLRERGDDIELLTKHFVKKFSQEWGGPALRIEREAMRVLANYSFPGNLDELQAVLQRAVSLAENDCIRAQDLRLSQVDAAEEEATNLPVVTNNLEQYLENIERAAIVHALENNRWNKTAAAAKLGISFRTMRYRCTKLGIE